MKGWLEAARQEINKTWPDKVCLIIYILGTGSQRERERNDCHFMSGLERNKIEISLKWLQSVVSRLRGHQCLAIHPSPRCRHSIIQALWTWIKCHPTPDCLSTSTLSCWHWPPRPKRRLESISHVESQTSLSRSWRINRPELKLSYRTEDCSKPWKISGF